MSKKEPLPGAALLRAHIEKLGISHEDFAKRADIERTTLSRLFGGDDVRQRVAVPLARKIEDATGGPEGDVPMRSWDPAWPSCAADPNEVADEVTVDRAHEMVDPRPSLEVA